MEITVSNGKHGAVYKDESCLPDVVILESLLSSGYKMYAEDKAMTKAEAMAFIQKIKGKANKGKK